MIYELVYTSAPAGLRPGSSGYCTVQSSRGIPAPTVDLLESLSGYRHIFTAGTPEAANNPVNYGHYLLRVQGRPEHVLSRVSDCPLDHTGRSNKLGHHMVIDTPDSISAGPAWLLQQPGWMTDQWDGKVTVLNTVRSAPSTPRAAGKCEAWRRTVGDAGWAGVLAESFLADPQRKVFLIYQPGTDVLVLFEEALALLPVSQRWDVTFSTYGAALPATVECLWTGVIAGSQEEHLSKRFVHALRIDLTKALGAAPEMGDLVTLARTGKKAPAAAPTAAAAAADTPVTMSLSEDDLAEGRTSLKSPQRSPADSISAMPPPVRRRAKKSDAGFGRLVLIVVACCLLFGGGTAASLVYFLKSESPASTSSATILAESEKKAVADNSTIDRPTKQAALHKDPKPDAASESTGPPTRPAKQEVPHTVKSSETTTPEPVLTSVGEVNKRKDKKNKQERRPVPTIEYPPASIAMLQAQENKLVLLDQWDANGGQLSSVRLLIPKHQSTVPTEAETSLFHPFLLEELPLTKKLVEDRATTKMTTFDSLGTEVLFDGTSIATVSALVTDNHLRQIVVNPYSQEHAGAIYGAIFLAKYTAKAFAVPFHRPIEAQRGDLVPSEESLMAVRIKIPRTAEGSAQFERLTKALSVVVVGNPKLAVGNDLFEFEFTNSRTLKFVNGPFNPGVLSFVLNDSQTDGNYTDESFAVRALSFDAKPLLEKVLEKNQIAKRASDELQEQWLRIQHALQLTNASDISHNDRKLLDPENAPAFRDDFSALRIVSGKVRSLASARLKSGQSEETVFGKDEAGNQVTKDDVEKYLKDRIDLMSMFKEADVRKKEINDATLGGFSIATVYELPAEYQDRLLMVPILNVSE
ncbi:GAP1-N2 domain-containing protein [Rubinisphaera margarita]|uniref:GAP1-N2 domain-containing protein n=1 Tax=Rubinisphaera margarita TaxID=2909586 RepID=UPI001EE8644A|nr:hypothetical protein [Rubinisphaera margarita]MCG6155884.1 hypothetical protein [Rubinisphaera margarita]